MRLCRAVDNCCAFVYNSFPMETNNASLRSMPTRRTMVLIGCAWFGMSTFLAFHMASIPLFFNARIEQKWIVGLILGMIGGFGIAAAPIVGFMSDRIRHRLGRRRPLMIVGLPLMVAVLVGTQHLPWVWLMALVWPLAYFAHLLIERPWSALIPDLFPPEKRATANGVCQLMGGTGNLLFFVVGGYLWARNEEVTFYLVAAVFAAGVLAVVFGIKERPTHLDEPRVRAGGRLSDYVKGLRAHDALLKYTFASLFWNIGLNAVLPWLTSFGTKEIGMSVNLSFMILALSVGVLIVFAIPIGILADRIGHKRVINAGLTIFVVINICVVFVHSVPLLFALMGSVAFGFCVIMVVPYALAVNLIPEDRMAELIGVAWIPIYLSALLGPVISGMLIDLFGSYRPIFVLAAVSHAIGLLLLQGVPERKTHAST